VETATELQQRDKTNLRGAGEIAQLVDLICSLGWHRNAPYIFESDRDCFHLKCELPLKLPYVTMD